MSQNLDFSSGIESSNQTSLMANLERVLKAGPEGVKWEWELAHFCPGKMGFRSKIWSMEKGKKSPK